MKNGNKEYIHALLHKSDWEDLKKLAVKNGKTHIQFFKELVEKEKNNKKVLT